MDLDRDPRESLGVQRFEERIDVAQLQIRHGAMALVEPREKALDVPAAIPDRVRRQPALLRHPLREVVDQAGKMPRTERPAHEDTPAKSSHWVATRTNSAR